MNLPGKLSVSVQIVCFSTAQNERRRVLKNRVMAWVESIGARTNVISFLAGFSKLSMTKKKLREEFLKKQLLLLAAD